MKDKNIETNFPKKIKHDHNSTELIVGFNASSPVGQQYAEQANFVPLSPTETGRKRHAAHQLQAPKFALDFNTSMQNVPTELYLG